VNAAIQRVRNLVAASGIQRNFVQSLSVFLASADWFWCGASKFFDDPAGTPIQNTVPIRKPGRTLQLT
jgi:hypothetical protein